MQIFVKSLKFFERVRENFFSKKFSRKTPFSQNIIPPTKASVKPLSDESSV